MTTIRTRTIALTSAIVLAGCAASSGNRPAKLVDIDQVEIRTETLWTASAGVGGQGPFSGLGMVIQEGRLYTADAKGRVYALNVDTGEQLWRVDTDLRLLGGPGLADGQLLLGTLAGEVVALSAEDGSQQWATRLSSEVLARPAGGRGVVVARGADGRIYGLDASNGQQGWVFERATPSLTLRGLSDPVIVGRNAILGLDTGELVSLDLRSGEPEWQRTVREPTGRNELERIVDIDADLLVDEGRIFAVSYGGELAVMTESTGRELWRRNVSSYSGMAVDAARVFVSDAAGTVWALDADTGAKLWTQDALAYRQLTAPVLHKGNLVVGDLEGYLHWLSPADGSLIARRKVTGSAIAEAPQVYGGVLFVLGSDGKLRALDTAPVATAAASDDDADAS